MDARKTHKKSQSNLGRAGSPPLMERISLVTVGCPHLSPNCPFPSTICTTSNTLNPRRPHSPPQTASGSNQPFCHSTPFGQTDRPTGRQTDRQTDRQSDTWDCRQVCTDTLLRSAILIESDVAKIDFTSDATDEKSSSSSTSI